MIAQVEGANALPDTCCEAISSKRSEMPLPKELQKELQAAAAAENYRRMRSSEKNDIAKLAKAEVELQNMRVTEERIAQVNQENTVKTSELL